MTRLWICVLVVTMLTRVGHSDEGTDAARAHNEKAVAAFALEHYAEAAIEYEAAFSSKPDPALLYDAAQSHRLAGNLERALHLYQSYLRIFGGKNATVREKVEHQVANLEATIAARKNAPPEPAPTPPPPVATVTPAPTPAPTPPPPTEAPPVGSAPSTNSALVSTPTDRPKPVYKKGWFWGVVVGSVVVAGVGLGVGLGLGLSSTKNPGASFGAVTVH